MAHIQKFIDYNQKTLKKTLSYYFMHITIAMLVGYFVTGNIWMALTLSLLEPTVHEKVWEAKASNSSQSKTEPLQNI